MLFARCKTLIVVHFNFSDKHLLHFGGSSIVCAFGVRYKSYCSHLVRTILVNPCDEVKKAYMFLIECEELLLKELKHGSTCWMEIDDLILVFDA